MSLANVIESKPNKLLVIPLILFIISILFLSINYSSKGYLIDRDISLKGGTSITVNTEKEINIELLSQEIENNFPNSDFSIRKLTGFSNQQDLGIIIESSSLSQENLEPLLEDFLNQDLTGKISFEETGSSLGESFFNQMIKALIFAFILMGLVVLITFRKLIPSLAVIFSAFLDIFVTFAIISFLDFKLSAAGIAAFLMVIGYSIDTDILLTTRLLKRNYPELKIRIAQTLKTGLTMTITTIIALSAALFITNSLILKEMFSIIIIALFVDILSTWSMNAPLLIKYIKKKNG